VLFTIGKAVCGERSHAKLVKNVERWISTLYNFKRVSLLLNNGDHLCKVRAKANIEGDCYTSISLTLSFR
jgi:hypothetical protein